MLHTFRTAFVNTIYPPRCLACPAPTEAPHGLCAACWADTHFTTGSATCGRCGVPLIGTEAEADAQDHCDSCLASPPGWDRGAAAVVYSGAGRRVVLSLKHGDRLDLVRPLAGWMASAGQRLLEDADLVVPVPLHWRRLLKRRYNQSAELARILARGAGKPLAVDVLTRCRATTPQERMTAAERAANQAGAFAVSQRHHVVLDGANVLLIDDVLTSGATLSSCAAALRAAGAARVDVLVLARVATAEVRDL